MSWSRVRKFSCKPFCPSCKSFALLQNPPYLCIAILQNGESENPIIKRVGIKTVYEMELKYITKDGAVITRVMTADEERSIPSKAKPDGILWKHFKYNNNYQVTDNCFKVSDLIGLSMVFGCEFAAYTQNGQLFIQKGNEFVQGEGIAGKVRVPQNARVLMHVHPVFTSYASHLDTDFAVMPNDVTETVVDYKFNIIIYRKDDEHENMIYNLKKMDDSLEQTDYKNPNWPDFLTKTPNQHVEIISV